MTRRKAFIDEIDTKAGDGYTLGSDMQAQIRIASRIGHLDDGDIVEITSGALVVMTLRVRL